MKLFARFLLLAGLLPMAVGATPIIVANEAANNFSHLASNEDPVEFDTRMSINEEMETRFFHNAPTNPMPIRSWDESYTYRYNTWFCEDWSMKSDGSQVEIDWNDTDKALSYDGLYGRWCYVPLKIDIFMPAQRGNYKIKLNFKWGFNADWEGACYSRIRGANLWYFTDDEGRPNPKGYPLQFSEDCTENKSDKSKGYECLYDFHENLDCYKPVSYKGQCIFEYDHQTGVSGWVSFYFGFAFAQRRHDHEICGQCGYCKDIFLTTPKASEAKFNHYLYSGSEDYNRGFEKLEDAITAFNEMTQPDQAILYVGGKEVEVDLSKETSPLPITGSGIIEFNHIPITFKTGSLAENALDIHPIEGVSSINPDQLLIFRGIKSLTFDGVNLTCPIKIHNSTDDQGNTTHSSLEIVNAYNSESSGLTDTNGIISNCAGLKNMFEVGTGCRLALNDCVLSSIDSTSQYFESYVNVPEGSHSQEIYIVDSAFKTTGYHTQPSVIDISETVVPPEEETATGARLFLGGIMKVNEKYKTDGDFVVKTNRLNTIYGSNAPFYGNTLHDNESVINIDLVSDKWNMCDIIAKNCDKFTDDAGIVVEPKINSHTLDNTFDHEKFGNPIVKCSIADLTMRAATTKCVVTFKQLDNLGAIVTEGGVEKDIGKGVQIAVSTDEDYYCHLYSDAGYQSAEVAHLKIWEGDPDSGDPSELHHLDFESGYGLFEYSPATSNIYINKDVLCGPYVQITNEHPATIKRSIDFFAPHCTCEVAPGATVDIEHAVGINIKAEGSFTLPKESTAGNVEIYNISTATALKREEDYTYEPIVEVDETVKMAKIVIKEGAIKDDLLVYIRPQSAETDVINEGTALQLSGGDKVRGGENYIAIYTSSDYLKSELSPTANVYVKYNEEKKIQLKQGKDYFWELDETGLFGKLTVLADSISAELHIDIGLKIYDTVCFVYLNDNEIDPPHSFTYDIGQLVIVSDPSEFSYKHDGMTFIYWTGSDGNKYYAGDIIYAPVGDDDDNFYLVAHYEQTDRDKLDAFVTQYIIDVPESLIPETYEAAKNKFNTFERHTRVVFSSQSKYVESFNKLRSWAQKCGEDYNFITDKFERC